MKETSREYHARVSDLLERGQREEARSLVRARNALAKDVLLPMLKIEDRLRAIKAECGASEASFHFSHWEGGWIVSRSGRSIAPSSVYSVNGEVLRF